jgi:hypothetical protein
MTNDLHHRRVIALDLRPRQFGFAIMEGPRRLLDWGVKRYRTHGNAAHIIQKRISRLLTLFAPTAVILEFAPSREPGDPRRQLVLEVIQTEVLRRAIDLVLISKNDVRDILGGGERVTKLQLATDAALIFPELSWKLPRERKPWQSQQHNIAAFTAISLALAYWKLCASVVRRGQPP